ncbi:hypothetical protein Esti_005397 [Eimeria stiedai]
MQVLALQPQAFGLHCCEQRIVHAKQNWMRRAASFVFESLTELSSSATSEGLDKAIHSDVRPQLSVDSGQRRTLVAESWKGKVLRNRVVPPLNKMLTEARQDLIRTPAAQQTKPVVQDQKRSPSAPKATTRLPTIIAQHDKESGLSGVAKETSSAAKGFTPFAVRTPERRLEYSELSARQPREHEQRIPRHVDERTSAAERQPSPQQDKHYASLVAALKERYEV